MKISRYRIFRTLGGMALGAIAMSGLWGCADDYFDTLKNPSEYDSDTQVVINLAIPKGEMVAETATRAITESGTDAPALSDPTQAPLLNELQINSLRLFLFPGNDMNAAPAINRPLYIPSASELENGAKSRPYEVTGLTPGQEYKMYIIGNLGKGIESIASRQALEDYIVDYTQTEHNLVAGNLPMVYSSSQNIKIPENLENGPIELSAAMQYACAKIRYSVIFDRTDFSAENFGESKLIPKGVKFGNVTKKSYVICNTDNDFYAAQGNTIANISTVSQIYAGYTLSADGGSNGEDVAKGSGKLLSINEAGKADTWIMQGTLYVPERYVADKESNTKIEFIANLASSAGNDTGIECTYESAIGEKSQDYKRINRGYYYEFIGKVVNVGADMMVAECKVHDWVEETMPADFIHTYLNISSTNINVTSLENGELRYDTDGRGEIGFECEQTYTVNGKQLPLLELAPVRSGEQKLEIRYNTAVPLNSLGDKTKGTTKCWITAGNIRKSLTVTYDFAPFLSIEPTAMKIVGTATEANSYIIEYRTNLGGIEITRKGETGSSVLSSLYPNNSNGLSNTISNSTVTLKFLSGCTATDGRILVTGTPDITTIVHEFTVRTFDSYQGNKLMDEIQVEIMQERQFYRVYFRSINDYAKGSGNEFLEVGGNGLAQFTLPSESGNQRWIDYWNSKNNNWISTSNHEQHYLYAYTQYGQDANTMPVWMYTSVFDKKDDEFWYKDENDNLIFKSTPQLKQDANNPGWYYYDLPIKCKPVPANGAENLEQNEKYGKGPLPGATLLIFHNGDGSDIMHRVNHADEPGIPLGDDNDKETWVLHDPTRSPIYNVYSDKPTVENVTYEIYSDMEITKWERKYKKSFHGTYADGKPYFQRITSGLPSGYSYGYKLQFKAVRGEYDKAVKVTFKSTTPSREWSDHKVFFVTMNQDQWTSADPKVCFKKKDGSGEMEVTMSFLKEFGQNDGYQKFFWYRVPEGYDDGYIRFKKGNADVYYCSGWKQITHDYNYIAWSNSNGQPIYDQTENSSIPEKREIRDVYEKSVDLFYGANWTKGYYKNGTWSPNP